MFHKILLPVDGSEHSEKIIEYVKDIAKQYNSEVTILHIYSDNPIYTMSMEEELKKYSFAVIDKVVKELSKAHVKINSEIIRGNAKELIVETAESGNYNLIVMGKQGAGKIRNLLIGSVSNYVIHHTRLPVFLV